MFLSYFAYKDGGSCHDESGSGSTVVAHCILTVSIQFPTSNFLTNVAFQFQIQEKEDAEIINQ